MREKQELLRNVNAFASNMFTVLWTNLSLLSCVCCSVCLSNFWRFWLQSWHDEFDYKEPPSSQKRTSWFKKQYAKEPKGKWNGKHGPSKWNVFSFFIYILLLKSYFYYYCVGNFDFCEVDEDFDIDYIFPGGPRGFSFSFTFEDDEPPRWHQRNHSSSRSKHHRIYEDEDDDYTTSTESSDSESESEPNQASHRQALGLSPSGPLNLKDVKHAWVTSLHFIVSLLLHETYVLVISQISSLCIKMASGSSSRLHQGINQLDLLHLKSSFSYVWCVLKQEAAEAKFKLCSVAYQSLCEKLGVN